MPLKIGYYLVEIGSMWSMNASWIRITEDTGRLRLLGERRAKQ